MNVVITNAYSAENSGDGLLVRLAINVIRRNFGGGASIKVIAADPGSFECKEGVEFISAPIMGKRGGARVKDALLSGRAYAGFDKVVAAADLLVAVGGGYMRSKNFREHIKLELGHARQLQHMVNSGVPLICLPQSIGPFYRARERFLKLYKRASVVFARDDRSYELLSDNGRASNVIRSPDLAVQEIASLKNKKAIEMMSGSIGKRRPERICVVLRKPPAWPQERQHLYNKKMKDLTSRLESTCKVIYGLQSITRGNDDLAYYKDQGIGREYIPLRECLACKDKPDLVVSVRLHGALEAILSGIPAYHISYERKGFGAYQDLGVSDWVSNSGNFEVNDVINHIFSDYAMEEFARHLRGGRGRVQLASELMDQSIKNIVK